MAVMISLIQIIGAGGPKYGNQLDFVNNRFQKSVNIDALSYRRYQWLNLGI